MTARYRLIKAYDQKLGYCAPYLDSYLALPLTIVRPTGNIASISSAKKAAATYYHKTDWLSYSPPLRASVLHLSSTPLVIFSDILPHKQQGNRKSCSQTIINNNLKSDVCLCKNSGNTTSSYFISQILPRATCNLLYVLFHQLVPLRLLVGHN